LDVINEYDMNPFDVLILSTERTLCEKIMSLVRFSQTKEPITDLKNKIRHIYDIHMMLKDTELNSFFYSTEFHTMILKVANDDVLSFKNNNKWLSNHPKTTILFSDTENVWNQIKGTYETNFKELVFGEFPNEKEIRVTPLNLIIFFFSKKISYFYKKENDENIKRTITKRVLC